MAFNTVRLDGSRAMLLAAAGFTLGVVTEQEAKKGDEWRDIELGQLFDHLRHEVNDEIRGNITRNELTYLIHNAADAAALSLMILARALEMSQEKSQ